MGSFALFHIRQRLRSETDTHQNHQGPNRCSQLVSLLSWNVWGRRLYYQDTYSVQLWRCGDKTPALLKPGEEDSGLYHVAADGTSKRWQQEGQGGLGCTRPEKEREYKPSHNPFWQQASKRPGDFPSMPRTEKIGRSVEGLPWEHGGLEFRPPQHPHKEAENDGSWLWPPYFSGRQRKWEHVDPQDWPASVTNWSLPAVAEHLSQKKVGKWWAKTLGVNLLPQHACTHTSTWTYTHLSYIHCTHINTCICVCECLCMCPCLCVCVCLCVWPRMWVCAPVCRYAWVLGEKPPQHMSAL